MTQKCLKTYQLNIIKKIKKNCKKKLLKDIKVFVKKRKKKKQQYGCERYKNLSEDKKSKLVEFRKRYKKLEKTLPYNYKKAF